MKQQQRRPAAPPAKGRSPLPRVRGWRIAYLVICTVGLCLSADLLRLHVKVHTDPDYHSYCAMSAHVNCETVAASEYAVFLGLPVALWGMFGYLVMGALAIWGLRSRLRSPSWPFGVLFWLTLLSSLVSAVMAIISTLAIESMCIVCAGTYAVNFGLLLLVWMALRRTGHRPIRALREELVAANARATPVLIFAAVAAVTVVVCLVAVPPYWRLALSAPPDEATSGHSDAGHPWIGASKPELAIVEYSDYQCPYCSRGHEEMRKLLEKHPGKVQLEHRHYPLDHNCNSTVRKPFHPYACDYALIALCADRLGRFWDVNDYLFANGRRRERIEASEVAARFGLDAAALESCMDSKEAQEALQKDIAAGRKLRIRGTPTFVVEGEAYPGQIPAQVLAERLGEEAYSPSQTGAEKSSE